MAKRRENEIKGWNRAQKTKLVDGFRSGRLALTPKLTLSFNSIAFGYNISICWQDYQYPGIPQ